MDSGVATRPIADFEAYRQQLNQFVFKSGLVMRPVFEQARANPKRVIFSAGEDDRVLRAVQIILDEGVAQPILIGRPEIVRRRAERLGLRFRPGIDAELIDPSERPALRPLLGRLSPAHGAARRHRAHGAQPGAHQPDPDRGAGGPAGRRRRHDRRHLRPLPHPFHPCARRHRHARGRAGTWRRSASLVMPTRSLFIADTYVNDEPDAETLVDITLLAADAVLRFGIQPKVALLSHSSFGSSDHPSARKMAAAVKMLQQRAPALEVDGEMHGDAALDPEIRNNVFPRSRLKDAGQPGDLPVARRRQHRLQPAEERRRRPAYRADAARHRAAGACADLVGHRPRHPQHDGAFRRRGPAPGRGAWLIGG